MISRLLIHLEVAAGLIGWAVLGVAAWKYSRKRDAEAVRDPTLERFCAAEPVLLALRCKASGAEQVARSLRRQIQLRRAEVMNPHGDGSWPAYRFQVELRRPAPEVLTVNVVGARADVESKRCGEVLDLLRSLGRANAPLVEQVWMHGQCFAEGRHAYIDRDRVSWTGFFDEAGRLGLETMIGMPTWVLRRDQRLAA